MNSFQCESVNKVLLNVCLAVLPFVDCENNCYFFGCMQLRFLFRVLCIHKRYFDSVFFYVHFYAFLTIFLMPFVYAWATCFFFSLCRVGFFSHFFFQSDAVRAFYHFHHTFIAAWIRRFTRQAFKMKML